MYFIDFLSRQPSAIVVGSMVAPPPTQPFRQTKKC